MTKKVIFQLFIKLLSNMMSMETSIIDKHNCLFIEKYIDLYSYARLILKESGKHVFK